MIYSRIIGTGSYLPERLLTNADFEKMIDTTDQWIVERTGIKVRHVAAENELTSDLAVAAARRALEAANVVPANIDLVIVAMVFWVLSGLWMWWEMKMTRLFGALAAVGGLALFLFFLFRI